MQARRRVLEQEQQRLVHRLRLDQVVVVEDEQRLAFVSVICRIVDWSRHRPLERRQCRRAEQGDDTLGDPWARPIQRAGDKAPEPDRVVVAGVERQPPNSRCARLAPVASTDVLPNQRGHSPA
jgi:hypothetical protein